MEYKSSVRVSYTLTEKIAKQGMSFTDGEFINECIQCSVDVHFSSESKNIRNIVFYGVKVAYKIWHQMFSIR